MRPEKQLLLDEIKTQLSSASALVLTRYEKLPSNKAADFRNTLRQSGSSFEVVRKRILVKAAEVSGFTLDLKELRGHVGVIYTSQDPVQMTKVIYQFRKENEETLEVLGGRFEGQVCSSKEVEWISKLPSKDQMRAELLAILEAPLAQTLSVMNALLTSVLYCIENKNSDKQQLQ